MLMAINNPNLSNEAKILLLCSRINPTEAEQNLLKDLIQKDINWPILLKFAAVHEITSLLYKNLSLINCPEKEVMDKTGTFYSYMVAHNKSIYDNIHSIITILNEKNIKIILLKGVALTKLLYGDVGLRPLHDIDILVHVKDWPCVRGVLKDNNYYSTIDLFELHALAPNRFNFHVIYANSKKDITNFEGVTYYNRAGIEPKLKISEFDFYKNITGEVWEEAIDFSIDGAQSLILSYEDMIISLYINLSKYNYHSLIQYCDLNELILKLRDTINWDALIRKSRQRHLSDFVYFSSYHLKHLFNTPIPQNILKEFTPSKTKIILFNKIFTKPRSLEVTSKDEGSSLPFEIRFLLITYRFTNFKMAIKIIKYLLSCVFPSPKYLSYRYNITSPVKIPIYYMKRIHKAIILLLKSVIVFFIPNKS